MLFRNVRAVSSAALAAVASLLATDSALAHHVMGGRTPSTFMEGLLSGLGHPIIGVDHAAFLVAIGVVVGVGRLNLLMPVIFVVAAAVGVALHVQGVGLPGAEILVAASVIIVGAAIVRKDALAPMVWGSFFALAGLFHGYAYGESIFGAERTPLIAYLIGLVIVQTALAIGIALVSRRVVAGAAATLAPRLTGAVVVGIGLAVLAQHLVSA
jgi:urease accessory protein